MTHDFIKVERIIRAALGLLEREIVLPRLVWRDAGGDFAGAKNDTISLRLPSYTAARSRTLRAGTAITADELHETKVDVTLDTDLYKAVTVSDEQLTLDIESFGEQVLSPVVRSIAYGVEDVLIALMAGADYERADIEVVDATAFEAIVDARKALNDARVPVSGRALVVGSQIEAKLLKSDQLARYSYSGDSSAFRDANIGRIVGFDVVTVPGIAPDVGYAFHSSAFVLSMKAPVVPEGATWGRSMSFAGLAMRVLRDYDYTNTSDRLLADVYVGANTVADDGHFNANGLWVPSVGARPVGENFSATGEADTELFTSVAHGLEVGDKIQFSALTGGTGLTTATDYFVIASGLTADAFKLSETDGGAAVDFTTDVTASTLAKRGRLIRAVPLVDAS